MEILITHNVFLLLNYGKKHSESLKGPYRKTETCDSTLYINNVQIDIVSAEWRINKTADV